MVEIIAGTKSLAPGEALNGNSGGSKGIVELCDDICDALRGHKRDLSEANTRLAKLADNSASLSKVWIGNQNRDIVTTVMKSKTI
jgi:hypothetical protein